MIANKFVNDLLSLKILAIKSASIVLSMSMISVFAETPSHNNDPLSLNEIQTA